jgi:cell wall-associated NlpC family hydrolase
MARHALFLLTIISFFLHTTMGEAENSGKGTEQRMLIVLTALDNLGVKYRYGGTSSGGFDCSGFARFVYARAGITLPRQTEAQFQAGTKIDIGRADMGDLVFFKIYSKRISHVGIYLGKNRFIHAPSKGKKVSITDMTIPYWKKRYAGAATFIKE